MPCLVATERANAEYRPSYIPIAVFAGGTAGVGQAMAEALARYTKGRIHIVIIGQNEAAAQKILGGLTKPVGDDAAASGWKHEFVKCDATEMKNVRVICSELSARLKRINYLVISAGANSTAWSGETSEGLDHHLSLRFGPLRAEIRALNFPARYYSRFVYIQELVPLLTAAADMGQDARVMSVLGAGFGFPIATEDINNARARGRTYECLKGVTGVRSPLSVRVARD
jgi:NAD(P)-dependent dehydrogenase (short-subunit alcohol dehydrogenase family)